MVIGRGRGREHHQPTLCTTKKKGRGNGTKKVRGKTREKESKGKSHVTSGHFRSRMCNGLIPLIDPPQI